jgi:UPF0176 protein
MRYQVLLFYKYVPIEDPSALREWILTKASSLQLTGRVLIAEEGLNGTLEGTFENAQMFARELAADPRFTDMQVKTSVGTGNSFEKLSVKVRAEIVGTQFDPRTIDPRVKTGIHISPEELHTWYENNKDFVVVDMRNEYEFQSGHFKNSVNPKLKHSRDLPKVLPKFEHLKEKTVLTVCTGGVRCEKMSAYLLAQGFKDVYQLENGIHGYMEKYPGQNYRGALYTFDKRLAIDFGGEREVVGECRLCQAKTERYVNCANAKCHLHFLACDACQKDGVPLCSPRCGD